MRFLAFAGMFLGVLLLSACTTPDDIINRTGTPDMIYEQAGDQGRYYLGNKPIEHVWRWEHKTLYYFPSNQAFTFTDGYLNNTRVVDPSEERIYEELLNEGMLQDRH